MPLLRFRAMGCLEEVQQRAARARDSAVDTLRRDLWGEHHGAERDVFQDDCRFVAGEALLDEAVFPDGSPSPINMPLFDAGQLWGERGSCYKGRSEILSA